MRTVRWPALAALVFCSGCCALVYQIGWLRELRLVFGASTYATSAVLAIFMGGLGAGSALLGARADRHPRPLRLYGWIELGIAAGALLSPVLFALIRKAYVAAGGSSVLGQPLALAARLALSVLVLGLPTFLMGGTLPALAREAEREGDANRRAVALLYGVNTLGAVIGATAATFFLLEHLGTRLTVLSAAALNAAVAGAAFALSAAARPEAAAAAGMASPHRGQVAPAPDESPELPPAFVNAAAALAGFVFFLMEIVWYRMLSPLLGGTTYTFGLILAVALAGIGAGGLLWFLQGGGVRPTARMFAATCGLEAAGLALAFGMGDRLAILALTLRPTGSAGLAAHAAGWAAVCGIVVLPAALVAGYQFPLLIALRGRGRPDVGRDTGSVYAWNTAGSIAGSLVGGFGLLPALGAPGCWRLTVAILGATCVAVLAFSLRRGGRRPLHVLAAGTLAVAVLLIASRGPTAAWRHSAVGAGGDQLRDRSRNGVRAWLAARRAFIGWERDGIESSVALRGEDGLAFVVNGKVDGNARWDAGTQIMGPLVGAILHQGPRRAMVIGLGTGSSAGWLAAIDTVERVDVAELEPVVLEVARSCAPVNRDALANPKVRVLPGDGRELLLTSRERYDLIFSEPSNPYRAGIAALYTLEFYRAVAGRLAPGGIFSQWVQAYSVDEETVRRIAATLAAVFGDVEAWQTTPGDLLFVCSAGAKEYRVPLLASRVAKEPFRSGLRDGYGVAGVEGFLSGFLGGDALARADAARLSAGRELNTDDRSPVEFGFARGLATGSSIFEELRRRAREAGAERPAVRDGAVDWGLVDLNRSVRDVWNRKAPRSAMQAGALKAVYDAYLGGQSDAVRLALDEGRWRPRAPLETVMLAEALADLADERALALLPSFSREWPAAAKAVQGRFALRRGDAASAYDLLAAAILGFRTDPWNPAPVVERTLELGVELASISPRQAPAVFALLEEPLSVRLLERNRLAALLEVGRSLGCSYGERALAQAGPDFSWTETYLRYRAECLAETRSRLASDARRDLEEFLTNRAPAP